MGAAGTKERIIAAHKYSPRDAEYAERSTRVDVRTGIVKTHKRRGDFILASDGKKEVNHDGWY